MSRRLHIVCLDAPSPPDYGGVIDLYYKIPALAAEGFRITLHYFSYKEGRSAAGLEPFCEAIFHYSRGSFAKALTTGQSYIVSSRMNEDLVRRINGDDHPVLIEGIHCAGILPRIKKGKQVSLRLHNDEASYYEHLYKTENNILRRLYFRREYRKLQSFQNSIMHTLPVYAVSQKDAESFAAKGFADVHFLPCFLPWQKVQASEGRGNYCLYHGNLTISENREAVSWLLREIFDASSFPLTIAGRGAAHLSGQFPQQENVRWIESPTDAELDRLIREAQVHVLPSFNATGVKLKLLHVMFKGRHCITNTAGAEGSGVEAGVTIASTTDNFKNALHQLINTTFDAAQLARRETILQLYDNKKNARWLSERW